MFDLLIRGARIVDGTGRPAFHGDLAVVGRRIVEVGAAISGRAHQTIAAEGRLLIPGFVDVHTHYDGQLTWDSCPSPSADHGVTTLVVGNCGVGFAPCRPHQRELLIQLMEGVEDIPGAALADGLAWSWETFPEYLDALARMPRSVDVGALVPHGPVRLYAMGERGARNEPATGDDMGRIAGIVEEALRAGALGFSTSRTTIHRAVGGEPVPGTWAAQAELSAIAAALARVGGVFELVFAGSAGEDLEAPQRELAWMRQLSAHHGVPVTFGTTQHEADPEQWRHIYAAALAARQAGARLYPQTLGRTQSVLLGHETVHPFVYRPSYQALAALPLAEKIARLREPALRARILSERPLPPPEGDGVWQLFVPFSPERIFPLGDPPDYEPPADASLAARAAALGREPEELLFDLLLEDDGRALLLYALMNYHDGDLEVVREMMLHPASILGLGDGGAHCGLLCDASMPTFLLTHWARDRTRGERLPLELLVHKQTSQTASLFGLRDRGTLEPGRRADLNLVAWEDLRLHRPEVIHDLPSGARRLVQSASGYAGTWLAGVQVRADDQDTGERPGRIIRGPTSPDGRPAVATREASGRLAQ